jgi:predicted nucleotidyltransferase
MNASIDMIGAIFGGRGRIAILRLLAGETSSLTGTQIAELTGLTHAGATRALDHLAGLGIVSRRRVGRAVLNELERESILVRTIVLPALEAEGSLMDVLRTDLADAFREVATSVVLFGSVARGEAGGGSDIDVVVVTADRESAIRAAAIADDVGPTFFRRHGLPLSVMVTSEEGLPQEPTGFLLHARDDGVLVLGRPLSELMRRGV